MPPICVRNIESSTSCLKKFESFSTNQFTVGFYFMCDDLPGHIYNTLKTEDGNDGTVIVLSLNLSAKPSNIRFKTTVNGLSIKNYVCGNL